MANWYDIEESLQLLADIDEGESSHEVDQARILLDRTTGEFVLQTASACSCWGGDYDEDRFPTLDALAENLMGEGQPRYNPSLVGAAQLIEGARSALAKI